MFHRIVIFFYNYGSSISFFQTAMGTLTCIQLQVIFLTCSIADRYTWTIIVLTVPLEKKNTYSNQIDNQRKTKVIRPQSNMVNNEFIWITYLQEHGGVKTSHSTKKLPFTTAAVLQLQFHMQVACGFTDQRTLFRHLEQSESSYLRNYLTLL